MELVGTILSDEEVDHASSTSSDSHSEAEAEAELDPTPSAQPFSKTPQKPDTTSVPTSLPPTLAERRRKLRAAKPRPVVSRESLVKTSSQSQSQSRLKGKSGKVRKHREAPAQLSSFFEFTVDGISSDSDGELAQSWDFEKAIRESKQQAHGRSSLVSSLQSKIQVALAKSDHSFDKEGSASTDKRIADELDAAEEGEGNDDQAESDGSNPNPNLNPNPNVGTRAVSIENAAAQKRRKKPAVQSFSELNLSRPLLKAVRMLGFEKPTPIQAEAMPFILQGRDVCGSAVTGSGKTAAYLLPVLERLLFRPKQVSVIRVLVLTPTRELAQQVLSMLEKLARFTDVEAMAVVGGLSLQTQAAELRGRPDIVVATPGRLIDHVRNTQSVDLDNIEILILDEADRLLEMGFTEEVMEVVKFCPKSRQTLLFSATLTTSVNQLVELSLNRPVRVSADPLFDMAARLTQEFVRIRESRESDREAILLALCTRTFKSQVIIFFKRKVRAHRLSILFGMTGLKAAELHGNLTQTQRLESLQLFRDRKVDFLLCTDVASRGLDIQGVQVIINFEMPRDLTTYVHRVGRTARAGRGGKAVTLTGERQRKLMKEVLKRSKQNINSRQVPAHVIESFSAKIQKLEPSVQDVLEQERVEKEIRKAEMQVTKATNVLEHQEEIMSKPARTWFQSEKEKKAIRDAERKARAEKDRMGDGDALVDKSLEEGNKTAKQRRKERRAELREKEKAEANKKPHRLTRKKRRRMEILQQEEENRKKLQEEAKANGNKPTTFQTMEKQQKRSARTLKKKKEQENLTHVSTSIEQVSAKRKAKISNLATEADFSSEADLAFSRRQKKQKKNGGKGKEFIAMDVTKAGGLKKGGKAGAKRFKSKQKYNRKKR